MVRVCALDGCEITFTVVSRGGAPQAYCTPAHRDRDKVRRWRAARPVRYDMAARIAFLIAQRNLVREALCMGKIREACQVIWADAAADLPQGPARD